MIVIVEGIDRVGKTTLINKLKSCLEIKTFERIFYMKLKELDNRNETDKMFQLLSLIKTLDADIIFDRFHLSDYVYGTLERYYSLSDATENFYNIDKYISEMDDVFLIYIQPTDIERSSKEHGKDLAVHDYMFNSAFNRSKIKNKFTCTYETMDDAIDFIGERI